MNILIGGDYVPHENVSKMMERGDYSYLDGLKPIVSKSDLAIVNLEAPIVEATAQPITKCGPNLKTSTKVVDSLKYAGINMVTLANNHIMDYGGEGLSDTVKYLESGGILYVGIGKSLKDAQNIKYVDIKGKILAIVNCCEHEFSIATDTTPGANPLNPVSQYYAIRKARQNADYVLVIVHGGHEHWQLPSPRMVETYRFFVDAGADMVVNHHQHCYSGYETYHDKPIIYGIGNLCFEWASHKNNIWNLGYLVKAEFDESVSFEIIPYEQCKGKPEIRILPQDTFDREITRLNGIIKDPQKLNQATMEYYASCRKQIKNVFEPYTGRIMNKLNSMGLLPTLIKGNKLQQIRNYIACESHRDKVIHTL